MLLHKWLVLLFVDDTNIADIQLQQMDKSETDTPKKQFADKARKCETFKTKDL